MVMGTEEFQLFMKETYSEEHRAAYVFWRFPKLALDFSAILIPEGVFALAGAQDTTWLGGLYAWHRYGQLSLWLEEELRLTQGKQNSIEIFLQAKIIAELIEDFAEVQDWLLADNYWWYERNADAMQKRIDTFMSRHGQL